MLLVNFNTFLIPFCQIRSVFAALSVTITGTFYRYEFCKFTDIRNFTFVILIVVFDDFYCYDFVEPGLATHTWLFGGVSLFCYYSQE